MGAKLKLVFTLVFLVMAEVIATHAANAAVVVTISNFTFDPAEVKIHAGETVIFKNVDDIPHQVVADDHGFKSKALDTGDTATFTFSTAGDFGYFCGLHPHMLGKVIVAP